MSAKKIIFGSEARQKIALGIDVLATTVKSTLGPCGRNVVISRSFGSPVITKDGVSVAREVILQEPFENMGCRMVAEVANKTAEQAGDGTTTATVLAQAIFREGNKYVTAGANPVELKRGIDKAVACVVESIKSQSIAVTDKKEIEQVATISANSDSFIGQQIADAMDQVGRDGVITVEEAKGVESTLTVVKGMQLDRGYISPYFVTDQEKSECVLENAKIVIYDKKIGNIKGLLTILEFVSKNSMPLLIIADDVEGDALTALIVNKMRGSLNVCAIRAPGFGDGRKLILEDIALLTKGTFISEETGKSLETISLADLGAARKIVVKKDSCVIVDGAGDPIEISNKIIALKHQIEKAEGEYDKDRLKERLAKLTGGVAVIKVGAATELEMKEKKDRIDDALHATHAALEEGIVPGGGTSLIRAQKSLEALKLEGDEKLGHQIIMKALEEPLRVIASNGGYDGSVVVNKVKQSRNEYGFDAKHNTYTDMVASGIIDPAKVVRCALQNAASIAGLLLTTEAMISEIPEDKPKTPQFGNVGLPPL